MGEWQSDYAPAYAILGRDLAQSLHDVLEPHWIKKKIDQGPRKKALLNWYDNSNSPLLRLKILSHLKTLPITEGNCAIRDQPDTDTIVWTRRGFPDIREGRVRNEWLACLRAICQCQHVALWSTSSSQKIWDISTFVWAIQKVDQFYKENIQSLDSPTCT